MTTPRGERCPACITRDQQRRDAKRGSRQSRGYNAEHDRERAACLAVFTPGQACVLGGEPLPTSDNLDLAHNESRTGWLGLACAAHNRNTAGKR